MGVLLVTALVQGAFMCSNPEAMEQPGAKAGLVVDSVAQPSSTALGQVYSSLGHYRRCFPPHSLELAEKARCWPRCRQVALEVEGGLGT